MYEFFSLLHSVLYLPLFYSFLPSYLSLFRSSSSPKLNNYLTNHQSPSINPPNKPRPHPISPTSLQNPRHHISNITNHPRHNPYLHHIHKTYNLILLNLFTQRPPRRTPKLRQESKPLHRTLRIQTYYPNTRRSKRKRNRNTIESKYRHRPA